MGKAEKMRCPKAWERRYDFTTYWVIWDLEGKLQEYSKKQRGGRKTKQV